MIRIGGQNISDIRIGSAPIREARIGGELVWQAIVPTSGGYWDIGVQMPIGYLREITDVYQYSIPQWRAGRPSIEGYRITIGRRGKTWNFKVEYKNKEGYGREQVASVEGRGDEKEFRNITLHETLEWGEVDGEITRAAWYENE